MHVAMIKMDFECFELPTALKNWPKFITLYGIYFQCFVTVVVQFMILSVFVNMR